MIKGDHGGREQTVLGLLNLEMCLMLRGRGQKYIYFQTYLVYISVLVSAFPCVSYGCYSLPVLFYWLFASLLLQ